MSFDQISSNRKTAKGNGVKEEEEVSGWPSGKRGKERKKDELFFPRSCEIRKWKEPGAFFRSHLHMHGDLERRLKRRAAGRGRKETLSSFRWSPVGRCLGLWVSLQPGISGGKRRSKIQSSCRRRRHRLRGLKTRTHGSGRQGL